MRELLPWGKRMGEKPELRSGQTQWRQAMWTFARVVLIATTLLFVVEITCYGGKWLQAEDKTEQVIYALPTFQGLGGCVVSIIGLILCVGCESLLRRECSESRSPVQRQRSGHSVSEK
jgi:hypothetical protein